MDQDLTGSKQGTAEQKTGLQRLSLLLQGIRLLESEMWVGVYDKGLNAPQKVALA